MKQVIMIIGGILLALALIAVVYTNTLKPAAETAATAAASKITSIAIPE